MRKARRGCVVVRKPCLHCCLRLRKVMPMSVRLPKRSISRAFTGALLVTVACVLSGCGGGGANSFDPTDMLSFLDTKKPLPGTRHPVFPDGVPGVEQGVPKE